MAAAWSLPGESIDTYSRPSYRGPERHAPPIRIVEPASDVEIRRASSPTLFLPERNSQSSRTAGPNSSSSRRRWPHHHHRERSAALKKLAWTRHSNSSGARRPSGERRKIAFPVYGGSAAFNAEPVRRFISRAVWEIMERHQPYDRANGSGSNSLAVALGTASTATSTSRLSQHHR